MSDLPPTPAAVQLHDSPLAMFVTDARTNALLGRLSRHLDALRNPAPGASPPALEVRRSEIVHCKERWEEDVLTGEHALYDLATLITRRLTGTARIKLVARVIVGQKEEEETADDHRIMIEEGISRADLKRITDYSLAARIARHFQYRRRSDLPFAKLYARASFLEMRPLAISEESAATRVLTRVKAADQISNKVCDALFAIDHYVKRDRILNAKSKYVKDVLGIKILTPRRSDSYRVDDALRSVEFSSAELAELGLSTDDRLGLELLEHKDYLALPADKKKRTGWEAIKNVYRWGGHVFECQIQTEANYFLEELDLTDTSHRTFEMQRRNMRHELEKLLPHYQDFREVLKFLMGEHELPQPPAWLRIVEDIEAQ